MRTRERAGWVGALVVALALLGACSGPKDLGGTLSRIQDLRAEVATERASHATAVADILSAHAERVAATEARLREQHDAVSPPRNQYESDADYNERLAAYRQSLPAFTAAWAPALEELERERDAAVAAAGAARDGSPKVAELLGEIAELEGVTYAVDVAAHVGSYRTEDGSFALTLEASPWAAPTDAVVPVPAHEAPAARETFDAVTVEYGIENRAITRRGMWIGRSPSDERYAVHAAGWRRAHRLAGHAGPATGAVLVGGSRALTAGGDGRLMLWSMRHPFELIRAITAHDRPVRFLVRPAGAHHAVSGTAHEIKLWDPRTLELFRSIDVAAAVTPAPAAKPSVRYPGVRYPEPTVSAIAVSNYSPLMAFAVDKPTNTVAIWDYGLPQAVALIRVDGSVTESLAFAGRGSRLAAGLKDGRVLLWDIRRKLDGGKPGTAAQYAVTAPPAGVTPAERRRRIGREKAEVSATPIRTIAAHDAAVRAVAFTPDGETVVTGSADKTAAAWDVASGERRQTFSNGHTGAVTSLAMHRKGARLITGGRDGTARLWDMATGEEVRKYRGHKGVVHSVTVGDSLLTASEDGSVRIWRPGTGREQRALRGHVSRARLVGLSRDGRRALTSTYAGEVALWNTITGEKAWGLPPGSNDGALALSSDGRLVASERAPSGEAGEGVVRVWDTVKGGDKVGSFASSKRQRIGLRFVDNDARLLVTPASAWWPVLREVEDLGRASPVVSTAAQRLIESAGYGSHVSGDGRIVVARTGIREITAWDVETPPSGRRGVFLAARRVCTP